MAMHDIALLKLEHPFTYSKYVRPVCLPQSAEVYKTAIECHITGWGAWGEWIRLAVFMAAHVILMNGTITVLAHQPTRHLIHIFLYLFINCYSNTTIIPATSELNFGSEVFSWWKIYSEFKPIVSIISEVFGTPYCFGIFRDDREACTGSSAVQ